ncbi:MAG: hypothetical protein A4E28_02416 [Methanocella sp. PtaU1.Bin125]|nr:MAG: hypothetical protein A4E28_02416 [Methanocella sp. PtaU1.Bin125]
MSKACDAYPDNRQPWLAQAGNVVTAVPAGGGQTVMAVSGRDGSYSLDVKPFIYSDLIGQARGPDEKHYDLRFVYGNGVSCTGFMLRENETVTINYYAPGIGI